MRRRRRDHCTSARCTTPDSISPSRLLNGEIAGFGLFWFDPVTGVGLVEPLAVEDAYRGGVGARAMLTAGLERLAKRGARRLKVGYATNEARNFYAGAGFGMTSTQASYRRRRAAVPAQAAT
jgi:GNAT superfamily N-acetyltransferase